MNFIFGKTDQSTRKFLPQLFLLQLSLVVVSEIERSVCEKVFSDHILIEIYHDLFYYNN